MKKILMHMLLGGLLIFGSSCGERIEKSRLEKQKQKYEWTEKADKWQIGYNQTQNFLQSNPGKHFSPSKEYTKQNNASNASLEGLLYSDFNEEIARDIAQTHLFFFERIPELIDYIRNDKSNVKDIYENLDSLTQNSDYLKVLKELYPETNTDCRIISCTTFAVLMSNLIKQKKSGSISLVTGIYFGRTSPRGLGHQWVVADNKEIIDPAVRIQGKLKEYNKGEYYIPIVETKMRLKDDKSYGRTEIITMPNTSLAFY